MLQLVFGWSCESYYRFRIHGQEIGTPRQVRSRVLREFRLHQREKFFYTYDFLDLWDYRAVERSNVRPVDLDHVARRVAHVELNRPVGQLVDVLEVA